MASNLGRTNFNRHFFPSTETEAENDEGWEEVKGEESAENGAPEIEAEANNPDGGGSSITMEGNSTTKLEAREGKPRVQLPDVPTVDPNDEGPATKKQKSEG